MGTTTMGLSWMTQRVSELRVRRPESTVPLTG